jgi:hypothetical protein
MTPEHIHLALNHVPVLGAAFSILPLAWGLLRRNQELLLCGVVLAGLSAWVTPLVMSSGEAAYERYESPALQAFLDPDVHEALELHEHRAHDWSKLMYVTAVLATLTVVANMKKKEWVRPLTLLLLLFCLLSVASGVWIAESGGKIRRVDFRIEDVR